MEMKRFINLYRLALLTLALGTTSPTLAQSEAQWEGFSSGCRESLRLTNEVKAIDGAKRIGDVMSKVGGNNNLVVVPSENTRALGLFVFDRTSPKIRTAGDAEDALFGLYLPAREALEDRLSRISSITRLTRLWDRVEKIDVEIGGQDLRLGGVDAEQLIGRVGCRMDSCPTGSSCAEVSLAGDVRRITSLIPKLNSLHAQMLRVARASGVRKSKLRRIERDYSEKIREFQMLAPQLEGMTFYDRFNPLPQKKGV